MNNCVLSRPMCVVFITKLYNSVNSIGTLNLLQAIKDSGLSDKTKFYQASTSELFGEIQEKKQSEKTKFYPQKSLCNFKAICILDNEKL